MSAVAQEDPGLCAACRHARAVRSGRGSTFWLCRLALLDSAWPKYPRLPVLRCAGYRSKQALTAMPVHPQPIDPEIRRALDALPSPADWPLVGSRSGPDLHIFRVRVDDRRHPKSGVVMERVALEAPDWVNVIALTPERRVLLVRQFRFGSGAVSTEIPAGMVDPGESHDLAARRELLEETGFASQRWTYLGAVAPNPAFLGNLCHHWLAEGCVLTGAPRMDGGEDIELAIWPLEQVADALRAGAIDHSLVVSAFSRILDLRVGHDLADPSV